MRSLLYICAVLAACKPRPTTPTDNFDRAAMLTSIADNVILPALRDSAVAASAMKTASDRKAAWETTMAAWQRAEVVQVGPAALASMSTAGKGLRERIYVWPVIDECEIDRNTLNQTYDTGELGALEYLLFRPDQGHACAAGSDVDAAWPASDVVTARRGAYASAIIERVAADTQALVDAWDQGYRDRFVSGGDDSVNELFQAIYYFELIVKDRKLARPLALSSVCTKASCPELQESRWSQRTRLNLAGNLETFERVITGGGDTGFDDFLIARGGEELAKTLLAEIDAAQATLAALPGGDRAPLTDNLAKGEELYAEVKDVCDLLKTQFITVLSLRVPREGAGDND